MGQGLLIHEVSRSHSTTHPHSVGLLWTSDQLVAETSTWQHTAFSDRYPCPRWDSSPQSQQASGRSPTPLDGVATGAGNQAIYIHKYENRTSKLLKATSHMRCNQTCVLSSKAWSYARLLFNGKCTLLMSCVCRTVMEMYQVIFKAWYSYCDSVP